jgi:mercuric ion transport protein
VKTIIASVITAIGASVCCIGPVVAVTVGAGALGAASIRFEPYRPAFLALTLAFLGLAFYRVYRPAADACAPGATCPPAPRVRTKLMLWVAATVIVLLIMFPYYVEFLL